MPINAYDADSGINATLEYSLVTGPFDNYFNIDPNTGQLFLVKHLDRELLKQNLLTAQIVARQVSNFY